MLGRWGTNRHHRRCLRPRTAQPTIEFPPEPSQRQNTQVRTFAFEEVLMTSRAYRGVASDSSDAFSISIS